MVTVKVTETYDMKTTIGKMGIIGIHTPEVTLLRRLYPGLLKNYKFIRFKKCDVVGACASVLPADPLQVGVSAGSVAPEDMFNPILYKAVTNESFDTLVSRVMLDSNNITGVGSVASEDTNLTESATFNMYYGLLSENGEYRKAMPQDGFKISNLVPICHTLISNYGQLAPIDNQEFDSMDSGSGVTPEICLVDTAKSDFSTTLTTNTSAVVFRGKPVRMPRIPIHYGVEAYDEVPNPELVKTMVACLIVPPARLHEFFYRVRVTWYVSFEGLISALQVGNFNAFNGAGTNAYAKTYTYSSSKSEMESNESSLDATNVDINKIMES